MATKINRPYELFVVKKVVYCRNTCISMVTLLNVEAKIKTSKPCQSVTSSLIMFNKNFYQLLFLCVYFLFRINELIVIFQ